MTTQSLTNLIISRYSKININELEKNDLQNLKVVNTLYSQVKFTTWASHISGESLHTPASINNEKLGILVIVKSAVTHFSHRSTIRNTWGNKSYLSQPNNILRSPTRLFFLLGLPPLSKPLTSLENELLLQEEQTWGDMIFADFEDTYFNNTYKSMSALRWATEGKVDFEYLLLLDDDMFINMKNLVSVIQEEETKVNTIKENSFVKQSSNESKILFMGKCFLGAKPMRNIWGEGM